MKNETKRLLKPFTPLIFPFVRLYWFIFKPITHGAKAIIEHEGEILLIRNAYGFKRWTFPGGGVKENESLEQAARREVMEEVGLELKDITFLRSILSTREGKRDNVHIFKATSATKQLFVDEIEIEEARWFKESEMPELSPVGKMVWKAYLK
jgi:ADP-ribose pyrophosphatase YjhB (NUDIX family)